MHEPIPHPNPALAALGITIGMGDTEIAAKVNRSGSSAGRPPLTDIMSPLVSYRGYMHEIGVGAAESIAAGHSAWYLLRSVNAKRVGEFLLHGIDAELRPTDTIGGAAPSAGTALTWGDTAGITAAIVVDRNLGLRADEWVSRRVDLPAIENGEDRGKITPNSPKDYVFSSTFASGTWTNTVPATKSATKRFLPSGMRFKEGDTLDIALVLSRAYIDAVGAARVLVGYAEINCYASPVHIQRNWR